MIWLQLLLYFLITSLYLVDFLSYCCSKSGRPLKKLSDRKGFSRLGHMANGSSPDCSGNLDEMHLLN